MRGGIAVDQQQGVEVRTRVKERIRYSGPWPLKTAIYARTQTTPPKWEWRDKVPNPMMPTREISYVSDTMTDEEPVGGNARPERACAHIRYEARSVGGPYTIVVPSSGTSTTYLDYQARINQPLQRSWLFLHEDMPPLPDIFADWLSTNDIAGSAFSGLPFLGELRKTVQMVRNPLSFLKAINVPKGHEMAPLSYVLRKYGVTQASNFWLVKKYGWEPLIGDLQKFSQLVYNMSEHYQRYLDGDQVWTKVSEGRILSTAEDEVRTSSTTGDSLTTYRTTHHAKLTFEYRVKPAAQTGNVLSYANYCARRFGLGLDSVAAASWELVPYSFVADWFIPVGSLLNAQSHTPCFAEFRKKSYHHTLRQESEVAQGAKSVALDGRASGPTEPATCTRYSKVSYYRNWLGHCPMPDLLKTGMTTSRTITALSLLAQRLQYTIPKRQKKL